jgi:integrase
VRGAMSVACEVKRYDKGGQCNRVEKVDVYGLEQRYKRWKQQALSTGVPNLTEANSSLLMRFVLDMEAGRNVARQSRRGARGYARLCNLYQRMRQLLIMLQDRGVCDVQNVSDDVIVQLFTDMERGVLATKRGTPFRSAGDYAQVFKAFWHWWMRVSLKEGLSVKDITEDVSNRSDPPKFVYLRKSDVEKLMPYFDEDEQVVLLFMFDSMVRAPTELLSLVAGDVEVRDGELWVTVRPEISKTIGRCFNLLYAGDALQAYVSRRGLHSGDHLFSFSPSVLNRKLKQAANQIWGDTRSHPQGDLYQNVTLYDFRHSGAVHFRLLAKDNPSLVSLDAIRHRAGWTDLNMLNYYTQFIGLDGRIERQGMLLREQRHELQDEVERLRGEVAEFKDALKHVGSLARQGVQLASGGTGEASLVRLGSGKDGRGTGADASKAA